jgi:hypothetical protein
MNRATRIVVSTFGVLAGLVGIEHGIGEVLQGNKAPDGIVILSWPGSAFFEILGGEPAMTLIPNLLVSGILAILFSLIFLVWAAWFVERTHGGLILILLAMVMLLVGGGFGPPFLGILIGVTATRINAPLTGWRAHLSAGWRRFFGNLWPWSFITSFIAWLLLFPGSPLLAYFFGVDDPNLVPTLFVIALGTLLLTIVTGFVRDSEGQIGSHPNPRQAGKEQFRLRRS